jgi:hypothetical protein
MMWDPAAAQELLDALFAKAAELDEWDWQRAQEGERRESKRCDTPEQSDVPVAFVRRARAVL